MPRLPLPTSSTAPISSLLPASTSSSSAADSVRFIYASHPRWPLPLASSSSIAPLTSRPLRLNVLDSSYNPPHNAHLALAKHNRHSAPADGHLLVFTATNCDKGTPAADAVAKRLEMVRAAAAESGLENVAVALMDAPAFVRKSRVLKREVEELLKEQTGGEEVEVRLSFAVGWDTLIRIFAPRYYTSPDADLTASMTSLFVEDKSTLVCARRGDVSPAEEVAFLDSLEVKPWRENVEMFDLEEKLHAISSTEVRKAAKEGRWEDVRRDVPFEGVVEILKRDETH